MNVRTLAAGLLLFLAACSAGAPEVAGALAELPSPAGDGSGEPFLSTDRSGRVHMSWLQKTSDSTYALKYARLEGEQWGSAKTIVERRDFFVNWADFPSVVISDSGRLVAHWLQRSGAGRYSYDIRIAQSSDEGATWTPSQVLHRDGVAAEHGFVALWPSDTDAVEAAWLDGRATGSGAPESRAMHLATTRISADGALGEEFELDQRNCDCCQVAAAVTARGPVVAYRDRTTDEVRDIAVVRRVNGAWTAPAIVHDDGWQIAACPVNGPALAARGDTLVVAWFTGAQDTARVRVAYSFNAGATFTPPQRIDGGTPAGRVDVKLLDDGSAAVSWLERTDSVTAEVRLRRVRANGTQGASVVLARASGARASGFPRLALSGDRLYAAWTQPGDTARVHVARYLLRALP